MKQSKNSNQLIGENTVTGRASFKDGKISYPNKPKSLWDALY